jgi:[protein-PII] uridylyltransferase
VLMVAALLHDLGKGQLVDHSVAGEPLAADTATRMGFDEREVALVRGLVRWHLLLAEVSTSRDLEDPATVAYVVERVPDAETLDLLEVLTEADARATSPKAWTAWRAGLVTDLTRRVRRALAEGIVPVETEDAPPRVEVAAAVRADPRLVDVRLETGEDGATVTVVSGDRTGLIADVAGALTVQRVSIRSARAWTQDDLGISVWDVDDTHLDEGILRQRLEAVVSGRTDPAARLRPPRDAGLEPSVQVRHDASHQATVMEVRVEDRPGVVYLVCSALARLDVSVRSAHLTTLGPQAVDVFYVQEQGAGALSDERAASAVHAVRQALLDPVTLDADRG